MRTLMRAVYENESVREGYAIECLKDGFMFNPQTFKEDELTLDNRVKESILSAIQASTERHFPKRIGSYIELKKIEEMLYKKSKETSPVVIGSPNAYKVVRRFVRAIYRKPPTVRDYLSTHFGILPKGTYTEGQTFEREELDILLEDVWTADPAKLREIKDLYPESAQDILLAISKMNAYH